MKYIFTYLLIFTTSSCFSIFKKIDNIQVNRQDCAGIMSAADTVLIKSHLTKITKTPEFRNHENLDQLNQIADYIRSVFSQYTDSVTFQEYLVDGKLYKNVVCSFGTENKKRIIIGAHYDVCGDQEGADDNASGVVGLLELSRLLKDQKLNYRIDLVAYTLEEPPYFRTENMGSYIHAKSLDEGGIDLFGMVSLEMIGYFDDRENTQTYPVRSLAQAYGTKGNFITLVNEVNPTVFTSAFTKKFQSLNIIDTKEFKGPSSLPVIDYSDHLNYWKFGFSALMVTDTSFYRNKNYHQASDKIETIDIRKIAKVIEAVYETIIGL